MIPVVESGARGALGLQIPKMRRPLSILYVIPTLPVGGAEQHVLSIIRGIDRTRFEAMVCSLGAKGEIGAEIERLGTEVLSLNRMRHKRWDFRIVADVRRLIKIRGIDIVHTHLYHANTYGRIAARLAGVKGIVATVHNVYFATKLKRRCLNHWLAGFTDRIIAVSEAVKDDIVRYDWVPPQKVAVIPNGIDIRAFDRPVDRQAIRRQLGIAPDDVVIGSVSRLERQKGQADMVSAFHRLARTYPDIRLVVVGDGSLRPALERQVADAGLARRVIFTGFRRDIVELLSGMDLFVSASLWEGQGVSVLEAMAARLPVVATRVGGTVEVVEDGVTGMLVPPSDAAALAAACETLAFDRVRSRALGDAGRARVESRFCGEAMIRRIEAIYEELGDRGGADHVESLRTPLVSAGRR